MKFCPSETFALLEALLASGDAPATLSDVSHVKKLLGRAVANVLQSERLCSVQQMAAVLQWVVQQACDCRQHLQTHPLKLLPTLRRMESDLSSSHVAISTSFCCQLLCAMFLDCFGDGSRSEHFGWPISHFNHLRLSHRGSSSFSTLQCILQYFVSVHASLTPTPPLLAPPLVSHTSFVVLHRNAVASTSSLRRTDTWAKFHVPMCPVVVSRGSLDPKISEGHVVVDFANKFLGGGVLTGGFKHKSN